LGFGDGTTCNAVDHPWYPFWRESSLNSKEFLSLKVSDLVESGEWKEDKIRDTFGVAQSVLLLQTFPAPPLNRGEKDRLFFTYARNSKFSLKKAYQLVHENNL
jgi:hypothetical protein